MENNEQTTMEVQENNIEFTADNKQEFFENSEDNENKSYVDDKTSIVTIIDKKPKKKEKKLKKLKEKKTFVHKLARFNLNWAFICTIIATLFPLSIVAVIAYFTVLALIMMATVFTILINERFRQILKNAENIMDFFAENMKYMPYAFFGAIGFSIISFILYRFVAPNKRKAGIVVNIILLILNIGFAIAFYLLDGKVSIV